MRFLRRLLGASRPRARGTECLCLGSSGLRRNAAPQGKFRRECAAAARRAVLPRRERADYPVFGGISFAACPPDESAFAALRTPLALRFPEGAHAAPRTEKMSESFR